MVSFKRLLSTKLNTLITIRWDKTVIDITSDMQKVVDEIIMIYDETAFGEPEPRCNSVYDYYGVGRNW